MFSVKRSLACLLLSGLCVVVSSATGAPTQAKFQFPQTLAGQQAGLFDYTTMITLQSNSANPCSILVEYNQGAGVRADMPF